MDPKVLERTTELARDRSGLAVPFLFAHCLPKEKGAENGRVLVELQLEDLEICGRTIAKADRLQALVRKATEIGLLRPGEMVDQHWLSEINEEHRYDPKATHSALNVLNEQTELLERKLVVWNGLNQNPHLTPSRREKVRVFLNKLSPGPYEAEKRLRGIKPFRPLVPFNGEDYASQLGNPLWFTLRHQTALNHAYRLEGLSERFIRQTRPEKADAIIEGWWNQRYQRYSSAEPLESVRARLSRLMNQYGVALPEIKPIEFDPELGNRFPADLRVPPPKRALRSGPRDMRVFDEALARSKGRAATEQGQSDSQKEGWQELDPKGSMALVRVPNWIGKEPNIPAPIIYTPRIEPGHSDISKAINLLVALGEHFNAFKGLKKIRDVKSAPNPDAASASASAQNPRVPTPSVEDALYTEPDGILGGSAAKSATGAHIKPTPENGPEDATDETSTPTQPSVDADEGIPVPDLSAKAHADIPQANDISSTENSEDDAVQDASAQGSPDAGSASDPKSGVPLPPPPAPASGGIASPQDEKVPSSASTFNRNDEREGGAGSSPDKDPSKGPSAWPTPGERVLILGEELSVTARPDGQMVLRWQFAANPGAWKLPNTPSVVEILISESSKGAGLETLSAQLRRAHEQSPDMLREIPLETEFFKELQVLGKVQRLENFQLRSIEEAKQVPGLYNLDLADGAVLRNLVANDCGVVLRMRGSTATLEDVDLLGTIVDIQLAKASWNNCHASLTTVIRGALGVSTFDSHCRLSWEATRADMRSIEVKGDDLQQRFKGMLFRGENFPPAVLQRLKTSQLSTTEWEAEQRRLDESLTKKALVEFVQRLDPEIKLRPGNGSEKYVKPNATASRAARDKLAIPAGDMRLSLALLIAEPKDPKPCQLFMDTYAPHPSKPNTLEFVSSVNVWCEEPIHYHRALLEMLDYFYEGQIFWPSIWRQRRGGPLAVRQRKACADVTSVD